MSQDVVVTAKLPFMRERKQLMQHDARMCSESLLRKLDFSRLHAETPAEPYTENCPVHGPGPRYDARLNYVCIKILPGIRCPVYCKVRATRSCFAYHDLYVAS